MIAWLAAAWAGTAVGSAADGWRVTAPDGWTVVEQGGAYVLGQEGRPGVVVVTYTFGATWADLQAQAESPLRDAGVVLAPVTRPLARQVAGSRAVVADYAGRASDGAELGAHGVGLSGPAGGLVIVGLGPASEKAELARRVDALAASVGWSSPDAGPVGTLQGPFCGGLAGNRMQFDGRGWVSTASPLSAADVGGVYSLVGDDVVVRFPDGAERRCAVAGRADGRVTALTCGGKPWTACP